LRNSGTCRTTRTKIRLPPPKPGLTLSHAAETRSGNYVPVWTSKFSERRETTDPGQKQGQPTVTRCQSGPRGANFAPELGTEFGRNRCTSRCLSRSSSA
jgi:hypothetical protein